MSEGIRLADLPAIHDASQIVAVGENDTAGLYDLAAQRAADEARLTSLESATFIAGEIFADTATGLAATALDAQFKVASAAAEVAFDIYAHKAGPTAEFVASVPQASVLVDKADRSRNPGVEGAHYIEIGANGGAVKDPAGFSIPDGQTGAGSYLRTWHVVPQALAGQVVKLRQTFDISAGFLDVMTEHFASRRRIEGAFVNGDADEGAITTYFLDSRLVMEADYRHLGEELEEIGFQITIDNGQTGTSGLRSIALYDSAIWVEEASDLDAALGRVTDAQRISSGNLLDDLSVTTTGTAGGVGGDKALTIPSGFTGIGSAMAVNLPAHLMSQHPGSSLRFTALLDTSDDLLSETTLDLSFTNPQGGAYTKGGDDFLNSKVVQISTNVALVSGVFRFAEALDKLVLRIEVLAGSVARAAQGVMTLRDLRFEALQAGQGAVSAAEVMQSYHRARMREIIPTRFGILRNAPVVVKQDGSGDYGSIGAAIAAEGGGKEARLLRYDIHPGIYSEHSLNIPDWAHLRGIGPDVHIKGRLAADAALADITARSTLDFIQSGTLENLKITAENLRYPVHNDGPDDFTARRVQTLLNCHFEHLGNDQAIQWQTDNAGNPGSVWASTHGMGCGVKSGMILHGLGCTFRSPTTGFYAHGGAAHTEPADVQFELCRFIATNPDGNAVFLQPGLTSQNAPIRLFGCETRGGIRYIGSYAHGTDPAHHIANVNREMPVFVSGGSPVFVRSQVSGSPTVLELRSKDVAGSSVTVSGTALEVVFGVQYQRVAGGSGFPGRAFSEFLISVINSDDPISLADRLGDRTGAPIQLDLDFEGSDTETVVFDADYTGMTNAAIIAAMNAQFADNGRAFYEATDYPNDAPVTQMEREVLVTNTGATVIPKGAAVTADGSIYQGQLASVGASDILGFAETVIAPGHTGKLQQSGLMHETMLRFDGTINRDFDTLYEVGANGALSQGTSNPVAKVIDADGNFAVFEINITTAAQAPAPQAAIPSVYVDPTGSDANSGSKDAPFASVSAAQLSGASKIYLRKSDTPHRHSGLVLEDVEFVGWAETGDTALRAHLWAFDNLSAGEFTATAADANVLFYATTTDPVALWINDGAHELTRFGELLPQVNHADYPQVSADELAVRAGDGRWWFGNGSEGQGVYLRPTGDVFPVGGIEVPTVDIGLNVTGQFGLTGINACGGRDRVIWAENCTGFDRDSRIAHSGSGNGLDLRPNSRWHSETGEVADAGNDGVSMNGGGVLYSGRGTAYIKNIGDGVAPHGVGNTVDLDVCPLIGNGKQGFVASGVGNYALRNCRALANHSADILVDRNHITALTSILIQGCVADECQLRAANPALLTASIIDHRGAVELECTANVNGLHSVGNWRGFRVYGGTVSLSGFHIANSGYSGIEQAGGDLYLAHGHVLRGATGIRKSGGTISIEAGTVNLPDTGITGAPTTRHSGLTTGEVNALANVPAA